jgi:hypothetical protein
MWRCKKFKLRSRRASSSWHRNWPMAVGRREFKSSDAGAKDSAFIPRRSRIVTARMPSTLENGRHAHAPRGADRDQAALGLVFIENFCERGDDACAGRREGVTDRKAAALHIEF